MILYTLLEDTMENHTDTVEVCVELNGELGRTVFVNRSIVEGTATGRPIATISCIACMRIKAPITLYFPLM